MAVLVEVRQPGMEPDGVNAFQNAGFQTAPGEVIPQGPGPGILPMLRLRPSVFQAAADLPAVRLRLARHRLCRLQWKHQFACRSARANSGNAAQGGIHRNECLREVPALEPLQQTKAVGRRAAGVADAAAGGVDILEQAEAVSPAMHRAADMAAGFGERRVQFGGERLQHRRPTAPRRCADRARFKLVGVHGTVSLSPWSYGWISVFMWVLQKKTRGNRPPGGFP